MSRTTPEARWAVCLEPRRAAAVRLLCLPHAGAGAEVFRGWGRELPEWVEPHAIQLPGRGMRLREPLPTDLGRLADELACALEPLTGQEFALFGHSMGALLAFELARRLERQGRPLAHLFVAGYGAPHVYRSRTTLHAMSHDAAVAELRRTRAVPDLVLDDEGMSRIFVPIVQSDIGMCVKHGVDVDAEPIAAPLSAFGGALDAEVPAEAVAAWGDLTTAPFRLRILPGDHFFPAAARSELLAAVGTDLAQRRVAA